jgi:hypothetical protein
MITVILSLAAPRWMNRQAFMNWPQPTWRNLAAIALLETLAARPHARENKADDRCDRR